jgi:KAP family P-loop domain
MSEFVEASDGTPDPGPQTTGTAEADQTGQQVVDGPAGARAASVPLHFQRSVAADLPSGEDLLGFDPLVKALHGLLNDASTVLPLAIAVTAPWGAGKSSVMHQLEATLRQPPAGAGAQRTWTTVSFDAWKYERSERLWAALAKAIYRQAQRQMSFFGRLRFRLRLELRRRGRLGSLLTLAWPLLVFGALTVALVRLHPSDVGTVPGVLAAAAVLLGTVTRYGNALANPFQRAIERHARRPDYETHLGFTAEADRDIRVLTQLIAPDDRHGLAVFVDDLDRCSSAHLVEVVEAMNQIFNSAREHRCVFVLGLDRDIVATNIKVAYAATVEQLCKDRKDLGERFGYEFLAKLVQLSVSIPEPAPAAMRTLLEKVTGNTTATVDGSPPASAALAQPGVEEAVERAQEHIHATAGESLESVAGAAAQITQAPAEVVAEAQRRELAERLEDSPEVAAAEFTALEYLERNPRQLKRFHNAFRLQLYVANEDQKVPFDFTAGELIALAKWVVVRLRWPELGNAITQDPQLLAVIEAGANQEPAAISAELATPERIEQRDRWLARAGVHALMSEPDADRRMGKLELKGFLRVA